MKWSTSVRVDFYLLERQTRAGSYDKGRWARLGPPIGASSIHIGFGWPVAVPLTLPFSSVAMRLGPVLAGPVHSRVSALRGVSLLCVVLGGGGCSEG